MGMLNSVKQFYETKYKVLLLLTLLLIPAALGVLAYQKATTGEYFQKGVSLQGGDTYTIPAFDVDIVTVQEVVSQRHPEGEITVRGVTEFGKLTAVIVEVTEIDEIALFESLRMAGLTVTPGGYSKESLGASLGATFAKQTVLALLIAFVMMALVVFITFRQLVPSLYVILAMVSTLLETLAVVSLIDVRLSTAGIAAFLMLIGYSVDADILLTNRALRQKEGTAMERIYRAMKTGITMTVTALVTTLIAYIFTDSDVIKQIMLILTIGLLFSLVNTWVQNVGVLRLMLERKRHE